MQASIRRLLTRHDAAIASVMPIELFHAEVTTLATSSDPVPLGASLSVSKLPWARGSLGGYVCLSLDENSTLKDDPRRCWVAGVYALTCHHVLRPTRPPGVEVPEGGELPFFRPIA